MNNLTTMIRAYLDNDGILICEEYFEGVTTGGYINGRN